jgi:hypothetical protein
MTLNAFLGEGTTLDEIGPILANWKHSDIHRILSELGNNDKVNFPDGDEK